MTEVEVYVRDARRADIQGIAVVHRNAFPYDGETMEDSRRWVTSRFDSFPLYQYWAACVDKEAVVETSRGKSKTRITVTPKKSIIVGYIGWQEKGGFRRQAVVELDQIGILDKLEDGTELRGKGIGTRLLEESARGFERYLAQRGAQWKMWEVTTADDNAAQGLYRRFGAEVVAIIPNMFDQGARQTNEVVMVGRGPPGRKVA